VSVLVLVALVSACGGGAQPQSKPTTATTAPAPAASVPGNPRLSLSKFAYAVCMRQHGVPMQDPDENADLTFNGVVVGATFQSAQAACGAGWPPSSRWNLDQILRAQDYVTKQRQCLTQHGVKLQDSGNTWALQPAGPPGDPTQMAGIRACNQELGPPVMITQPDRPAAGG
jgi:hypothetical protein